MRILTLVVFFIWSTALCGQQLVLRHHLPVVGATSFQFRVISRELMVARNNKQAILFRTDGQTMGDTVFRHIDFSVGNQKILATKLVQGVEKAGYLNPRGETVIPFVFETATPFKFGFATAMQQGMPVLIDSSGAIRDFGNEFNGLEVMAPGVLLAKSKRSSTGLIRTDGTQIYPQGTHTIKTSDTYFEVNDFDNNFKLLQHFYDYQGNKIPAPTTVSSDSLPSYLARKKYPNGTIFALKDSVSGKLLTGFEYEQLSAKPFGWLIFKKTSYAGSMSIGYMNYSGQTILERPYANHNPLSTKDILFYSDHSRGPWRWYDHQGRSIFADLIKKMEPFFHNNTVAPFDTAGIEVLAVSLKGDKLGLYNRQGQSIVEEKFDSMVYLSRSHLWFKMGKKTGIVNAKGEILANQTYDKIFRTGFFGPDGLPVLRVYTNKANGYITQTGKELLSPSLGILDNGYSDYQGKKFLWTFNGKSIDVYEILPEVTSSKQ